MLMRSPYHPPRTMRFLYLVVMFSALAVPGLAQLKNYKTWPATPEAYFLTVQEREEWATVGDDPAAEEFVMRYFERRGPAFREELLRRIELADKTFTIPRKKRGSETLRGKLLILLGSPVRIERAGSTEIITRGDRLEPARRNQPPVYLQMGPVVESYTWNREGVGQGRINIRIVIQPGGREIIQGSKQDLARLDALFAHVARTSVAIGR